MIEVDVPEAGGEDLAASLRERFDADYAALYGYSYATAQPQIAAATVVGSVPAAAFEMPANDSEDTGAAPVTRPVFFPEAGGYVDTLVVKRDELPAGTEIRGPAVIEDGQCAALLLPGDVATIDEHRNVVARIGEGDGAASALTAATAEGS